MNFVFLGYFSRIRNALNCAFPVAVVEDEEQGTWAVDWRMIKQNIT